MPPSSLRGLFLTSGGAVHDRLGALLVAALLTAGCGSAEPAQQVSRPVVEVAPVTRRDMYTYKEWIGTLDGYVNAEIRPQIDGHLHRQLYHEGSFVRKGDVLFEIDPRRRQAAVDRAEEDLARSQAALATAERDVEQHGSLGRMVRSQEELDGAMPSRRWAQADVDAARAALEMSRLNLSWAEIRSPIDGIAGSARAQIVDLVTRQTVMTTVSSVDPIKALFYASQHEYASWTRRRARIGRAGVLPPRDKGMFELILSDGSLYGHRGDLMLAGQRVDGKTGTIMVAAIFPNPNHLLRPGQHGRVRAAVEVKGALLAPQGAVVRTQGVYRVAVVGPDNKVDIRTVQTEERIGSLWVIAKGLDPLDRVILEGFQNVKPGVVVQPKAAEAEPASPATTAGGGD